MIDTYENTGPIHLSHKYPIGIVEGEREKFACTVQQKQLQRGLMNEKWNFRPRGDGRSGPWGPLLPEKRLKVFNMLDMEKDRLFWLIEILYLAKLSYYYAPPRPHRKWLCYFVPYGHGKLDIRFVHDRAEKCIWNGAHIIGRNRRGK